MDIGAFILAISFVVIVSVEIISYLINSEITKTKTEKKLFFFQTVSKVLFIVGSLRQGSFNNQLAQEAEKALAGKADVSYLDWSQVPIFSQDLEQSTPSAVAKVREEVQAADAIWIFSPVYNAGIPGSVRNLLDWLSRALDLSDTTGVSAINEKVVTVSISSFAHQDEAAVEYRKLLPFIRTSLVDEFTLATIGSPVDEAQLAKQADALLAAIN